MAQRLVTLVDTDVKLTNYLKGELARWGITAEVVADANDLMARKDDLPELVVLCIDPKRTGWAVCNRLRKSPLLKSVPLIITSAEATEKDFDDHKKLKTRAEEYLHKPFTVESLVDKIGSLVSLPQAAPSVSEGGEIDVETDLGDLEVEPEDIGSVEYSDELTMGGRSAPAPVGTFDGEDESTRIGFLGEIDGEVDLETNAAFAAIGLDDPAEQTLNRPAPTSPFDDDPFDVPQDTHSGVRPPAPPEENSGAIEVEPDEELPAEAVAEFDQVEESGAVPVHAAPADQDSMPVPKIDAADLELGLDDIASAAEQISEESTPAQAAPTAKAADSVALEEAHREIERLRKEVEEARSKAKETPASTTFSREREFLNLRETINKKEKEVLDLKDAVDARDRQVLDHKEKLRDAERKLREIEERSLATEREHVAAKEQIEALTNEKDKSAEREKQSKTRLEDTQKGLARAEEEIETWRTKHATDTAALDEKLNSTTARHREEMGALRQSQAEALADQKTAHTDALQSQRDEHASVLQKTREDHAALLQSTREENDATVSALRAQHESAVQTQRGEHENTLLALRSEHEKTLSDAEQAHKEQLDTEIKAAERRQGEAIVNLETKHEAQLAEVQTRSKEQLRASQEEAQRTLEQALADHAADKERSDADHARSIESMDEKHAGDLAQAAEQARQAQERALADLTTQHEGALASQREQHQRKLQALEESHEDLKAGMAARHATQVKDLREQHTQAVTEYDAAIAERDGIISQQRDKHTELEGALAAEQQSGHERSRRVDELETQLETQGNDVVAKQQAITERDARIAELEEESARYQDQVLRAYQRIKTDESTVARAKKALAIALTLLEENAETDDTPEAQ